MNHNKKIRGVVGVIIIIAFIITSFKVLEQTENSCVYEINYPDGNGSTITRLSNNYAESYFINDVHQHKYYFIPLNETDTIFFVGDNQEWNMIRLNCE